MIVVRLTFATLALVLAVGCDSKPPPDEAGGLRPGLTPRLKDSVITQTATQTSTSTQISTYTQSSTYTQTHTATGNTTGKTATASNLYVSGTGVGTVTVRNDYVGSKTYVWTATLTRADTAGTTFTRSGTATGTYVDNGVTHSGTGTTTSTMQFSSFATSTTTQTVAAHYTGALSKTMLATGTGTGWGGSITWTYSKTATGSHTDTVTQTQTQTLTETTTRTETSTVTTTATSTSVDGGTTDGGAGSCLLDWRNTTCGQWCLSQSQSDRANCWAFLDCYQSHGCGPATCGQNPNDVCGVNTVRPSMGVAPKTVADLVYQCRACPGTSPVTSCTDLPDTTPCTDGNACTRDDTCQSGTCIPGPLALPAAPTNLSVAVDDMAATVTWDAVPGAVSYNLKRSATRGGPYLTIASVTSLTYAEGRPSDSAASYYVVAAVGPCGESAASAETGVVSADPNSPPTIPMPSPTGRIPVVPSPGLAPTGSKGFYPTYDGDAFHFTLKTTPTTGLTSQQVLSTYVRPMLAAVEFSGAPSAIVATSPAGVSAPVADAVGLTQQVDREVNIGVTRKSSSLSSDCQEHTITATCSYQPTLTCLDGHELLRGDRIALVVPPSIAVTSGSPGSGVATLTAMGGAGAPNDFTLRYVGDGNSSYVFDSCVAGCDSVEWSPGKVFFTGAVILHLETGDPAAGDTVAAYQSSCGVTAPGTVTRPIADALLGTAAPTDLVEQVTQAAHGMSFSDFKAFIGRGATLFVFNQQDAGTTIEFSGVHAHAWAGKSVDALTGRVFRHYSKQNVVRISAADAPSVAATALGDLLGQNGQVSSSTPADGVSPVLFPYGTASDGTTNLRYAYRMELRFAWRGTATSALLWLDAENGAILYIIHNLQRAVAMLPAVVKDPNWGITLAFSNVDSEFSIPFPRAVLKRADLMARIDYQGNGYDSNDLSVFDFGIADFTQIPNILDINQALCSSGTNYGLAQTNFFATVDRDVRAARSIGVYTPYPRDIWQPKVMNADPSQSCEADEGLNFGACSGDADPNCPNLPYGEESGQALDNTIISHEVGHSLNKRLTTMRPSNWCCSDSSCDPACAMPMGWTSTFHDLADAWADHFESTNCMAGYAARSKNPTDPTLYCEYSSEGGYVPRKHELDARLNPILAKVKDHFPEHRLPGVQIDGYADGQIAAAIVWQVRTGLRSLDWVGGLDMYAAAFAAAIRNSGFVPIDVTKATSLSRDLMLLDLENQFLRWFKENSPTTDSLVAQSNKVVAGFARGGIFLIPPACIDGDSGTTDPDGCPSGDTGADAVIDLDDNMPEDDYYYLGDVGAENDYVKRSGPAPTFHVWTGPRYQFASNGMTTDSTPLCNTRFKVELSRSPDFEAGAGVTIDSDWQNADTSICYGEWTPDISSVQDLILIDLYKSHSIADVIWGRTSLYYRVTTTDANGLQTRVSTSPGNGKYTMDVPYLVVDFNGTSLF